jgi:hypothetical protein
MSSNNFLSSLTNLFGFTTVPSFTLGDFDRELGRAHEVCKRREDRLTKEDMGSTGVGEDGGRGDRAQQGSMMTVVVVGIV